jgi:hypothetical protein
MPYTEKQHRLFAAAASDKAVAKKHGMSMAEAKRMMKEGVKRKTKKGRMV